MINRTFGFADNDEARMANEERRRRRRFICSGLFKSIVSVNGLGSSNHSDNWCERLARAGVSLGGELVGLADDKRSVGGGRSEHEI